MQEKTTWLFELKDLSDDDFRQLNAKFDKMGANVGRMEKQDAFSASRKGAGKFKDQLTDIRHEIPLLDRGLTMLSSPIGMAAAATVGLGIVLNKANKAAKEFNHQFLELQNINLDKTERQIESLRNRVLDVSLQTGMDASMTSTGFFDVQSATGKYGRQVEDIVRSVGKFSQATKADFNTAIAGASKAMGIFNIEADRLDEFLESSGKTVQVGITTFDQLAKVQVEYAGAAAAANQQFDQANKLFAVFSKNAKSVDIAANLTKTAFQDLTKGNTIKGFEDIGVSLFDAAGEMRGLDKIMTELAPKLGNMSDQDFAALKENIGGSEGLRALLDQLKVAGDDVLNTFKQFDETEFSLDEAFKNAKEDAETMSQIIDNRLNTSLVKMGQNLQPISNWWNNEMNNLLITFNRKMDSFHEMFNTSTHQQKQLDQAMREAEENRLNNLDATGSASQLDQLKMQRDQLKSWLADAGGMTPKRRAQIEGEVSAYDQFINNMMADSKKNSPLDDSAGIKAENKKTSISGIESVNKMRNVTVNIGSLVQELRYYTEEGGFTDQEIEQKLTELLVRAVRDAEIALN